MRHLVVSLAVIFALTGDGWAQNRGSARYLPPEDYDGESTRAPRPAPTRGSSLRRQRPTKAPEPLVNEDELQAYQPPQSPVRTTGRRVPQRENTQQVAPPPPPPVPVEEPIPLYPAPVADNPESPPTGPEGRPQGARRRRPKKRRRPQSVVPKGDEIPEKQVAVSEKDKIAISELLNDDKKRTEEFQGNFQSRNAPSNFDSDAGYNPEKATWGSNEPAEQPQSNAAGPQYFRPQPATNRLPIDNSEPVGNSRRYIESSQVGSSVDPQTEFVPKGSPAAIRNEASYVPILTPIRVPSEGASRLPPEDYTITRNKEATRQTLPSDQNIPFRSHGNISPRPDSNTGTKLLHNIIPQPNEPIAPVRGHSEVRLPEDDQPLLSPEYDPSNFDSDAGLPVPLEPNTRTSEGQEDPSSPTNRLPNPSEVHYDSVYPEYSDSPAHNPQRIAGRRQEHGESAARSTVPSYSNPRSESGTKPHEYDNDAEVDRRQASQYRPPLQRTGSRYKPEDLEGPTRSRAPQPPSTSIPRGRGSSRYQPSIDETVPERTRSSTRHQSEPSDTPSRTRSSSTSQSSSRARVPQRYVPETEEIAPRTSSRGQSEGANTLHRDAGYTPTGSSYVPIDDVIQNEQRSPPPSRVPIQPPSNLRSTDESEDYAPIRNTLRSRPQYEIRDAEPTSDYDESVEDPNTYTPEYQLPRQPDTRGRPNQRTPVLRQQPPQPDGYQLPPNRQQNRQESHYEAPQNPRSRHQPQYQAPQNPRSDTRQPSSRQNAPSSRQQARPRHQESEPATTRSRSGSNFKCPDPFGFFADPVQCDKYYECRNGSAEMSLCRDGLAFNENSAPNFLRCDSLRDVDCKSRPELQEPQPTKNCPRRFGLFNHETDCTKFWNCVDGIATEVQCPPGLTYNDEKATCDWADLVETSCKTEDLLGFSCPEPTAYDLQDGVYSQYPHPSNCQLHFTCIKGADGLRRPRMLSCNEGMVFDPAKKSCTRPEDVPGCEEFYGPRPPPKRKPSARQPAPREPEEELLEEEPTPRPRRRGSSNRRARI